MSNIVAASAQRLDTGAVITCTATGNVVTITNAGLTAVPIIILAVGM